jgi:hypothetical protein
MVPKFRSLAIKLIEIAGIKKRKMSGVMLNKARMSDWFMRKNVFVKKYPFTRANTTKKIYAMGL